MKRKKCMWLNPSHALKLTTCIGLYFALGRISPNGSAITAAQNKMELGSLGMMHYLGTNVPSCVSSSSHPVHQDGKKWSNAQILIRIGTRRQWPRRSWSCLSRPPSIPIKACMHFILISVASFGDCNSWPPNNSVSSSEIGYCSLGGSLLGFVFYRRI